MYVIVRRTVTSDPNSLCFAFHITLTGRRATAYILLRIRVSFSNTETSRMMTHAHVVPATFDVIIWLSSSDISSKVRSSAVYDILFTFDFRWKCHSRQSSLFYGNGKERLRDLEGIWAEELSKPCGSPQPSWKIAHDHEIIQAVDNVRVETFSIVSAALRFLVALWFS